ncbi:hypothetical protein ECANGB1_1979 [Enterospora canceri]|uniref:Uncharacterized protein n=1 Tax=Enterospora canceri TaxID=1081671 RepID=A0A1Y1S579_9MICR|nr:hypothetical protein ECANGB1_1979 [Enterospora canceri]
MNKETEKDELSRRIEKWKERMGELDILNTYNEFYEVIKYINGVFEEKQESKDVELMKRQILRQQKVSKTCQEIRSVMEKTFEVEKMKQLADRVEKEMSELNQMHE